MNTDSNINPIINIKSSHVPPALSLQPPPSSSKLNSLDSRKSMNNLNLKISTPISSSFNISNNNSNIITNNTAGVSNNNNFGGIKNSANSNSSNISAPSLDWLAPPSSFSHHNENAQNLRKKISQSNLNNTSSKLSNQSVKLYSTAPSNPTSNAVATPSELLSPISPPNISSNTIPTSSTIHNSNNTSLLKKKTLLSLSIPDNHLSQQNSATAATNSNYDDILSDKSSNYEDDNDMTSVLYSARVDGPEVSFDNYNNNNNNNNTIIINNSMGLTSSHAPRVLPISQAAQQRTIQRTINNPTLTSNEFPEYEFKKNAYPNGPANIYNSLLYLYSEPLEFRDIQQFDLVVNVAKEVIAPFDECANIDSYFQNGDGNLFEEVTEKEIIDEISKNRHNADNDGSNHSLSSSSLKKISNKGSCKIYKKTKKSINENQREEPISYLYIPWSHTSKIFDNLPYLTSEIIYKFIKQNKKVLIHCQCGVSRSASLIIACIMKLENLNLTNAYNFVKAKAQDISPNMTLIFQLMEWGDYIGVGSSENKSPGDYYDPEFHKDRQLNDPSINNQNEEEENVNQRLQKLSVSNNNVPLKTPHHLTFQFNDDDYNDYEVNASSNMRNANRQSNLLSVPQRNSTKPSSLSNSNNSNIKKSFLTISCAAANSGLSVGGDNISNKPSKFTGYVKTPHYSRFQFNDSKDGEKEDDEDEDKDFDHHDEDENDILSPSAPSIASSFIKGGNESMMMPSISTSLHDEEVVQKKNASEIVSPSEIETAGNANGIIEKLTTSFK